MEDLKEKKKKIDPNYLKGVRNKTKRSKEIERGSKTDSGDKSAYDVSRFPTDFMPSGEPRPTKKSVHTKNFEKRFGKVKEQIEEIDIMEDLLEFDLLGEDEILDDDVDLLREFVEEILLEKKKGSNVKTALKNKAEKTGAPMGALRAIYNKGLAAWRTGHRPGASAHQWAMARVNSVLTGGPARKVDDAQWKQIQKHRGKKRKSKKK